MLRKGKEFEATSSGSGDAWVPCDGSPWVSSGWFELQSELLKGGYTGDYVRVYDRVYSGGY